MQTLTFFISYSREDKHLMEILASILETAGHTTWVDADNIMPGQTWQSTILQGLRDADFCIVILTPRAIKSTYVKEELELALNERKPLIPVRWEPVTRDEVAALGIGHIHYLDFPELSFRDGIRRLLKSIELLRQQKGDDRAETAAPIPLAEPPPSVDSKVMGKYQNFIDYLKSQQRSIDRLPLTFDKIESLIGEKLPKSAYERREWWANDSVGHSHSQQWLDAGWRQAGLNLTNQTVTFARLPENEQTYIGFFSELMARLRQIDFPLGKHSPNGGSWHTLATLPRGGSQLALYSATFTGKRQFRIELYIDTQDADRNKRVFGRIRQHEAALKRQLSGTGELEFEELSDKRASRIALYYRKSVTIRSPQADLNALLDWAAPAGKAFYQAIVDAADQALNELMRG